MLKKLCSKCGKIIPYGKYRCNECELKYQAKHQANKDNNYQYNSFNFITFFHIYHLQKFIYNNRFFLNYLMLIKNIMLKRE